MARTRKHTTGNWTAPTHVPLATDPWADAAPWVDAAPWTGAAADRAHAAYQADTAAYQADSAAYRADPTLIGDLPAQVDGGRRMLPKPGWGRTGRRVGRTLVWAIPAAAICFAVLGVWGWPDTGTVRLGGQSMGTWLVLVLAGQWLALLGAIALAALLSATPGRRWSFASVILLLSGTILLGPVLGVAGVARPAVSRMHAADQITPDAAASLHGGFVDGPVGRWLVVGGLVLLAFGWFALGCGVLACGVLNRADGFLILVAVVVGVAAAYLSWEFLMVMASMIVLAAGLGIGWTADRLTPAGVVARD